VGHRVSNRGGLSRVVADPKSHWHTSLEKNVGDIRAPMPRGAGSRAKGIPPTPSIRRPWRSTPFGSRPVKPSPRRRAGEVLRDLANARPLTTTRTKPGTADGLYDLRPTPHSMRALAQDPRRTKGRLGTVGQLLQPEQIERIQEQFVVRPQWVGRV